MLADFQIYTFSPYITSEPDRLKHVEAVAEFCKKLNIQYVGYEYTAVQEQAKDLKPNLRRLKLQYKILELTKTWLNDAQADEILISITDANAK